jgi:hypothetical protein
MLESLSARTTIAIFSAALFALAVVSSLLPSIRNAPSLTEIAPPVATEPAVPEVVG